MRGESCARQDHHSAGRSHLEVLQRGGLVLSVEVTAREAGGEGEGGVAGVAPHEAVEIRQRRLGREVLGLTASVRKSQLDPDGKTELCYNQLQVRSNKLVLMMMRE